MVPNIAGGPNLTQRAIDRALLSLEKCALELKTERNASADISRLPEEILAKIFTHLAGSSPLKTWYQINLVCRQWRDTALGTVALWSNPPTHNHALSMLMLERSKMADLCINIGAQTSFMTSATIMLKHFERIRSIAFDNLGFALPLTELFARPISRLRELSVCYEHYPDLSGTSPSLQQFDWRILPLPSLVHLRLKNVFLPEKLTVLHFLSTLKEMPILESLAISSDIIAFQHLPLDSPQTDSIHLPRLISFEVTWDVSHSQIMQLFSNLHLPQLSLLEITCESDGRIGVPPHSEFTSFLRVIVSTVTRGNFGTLDSLILNSDQWFRLCAEYGFRSFEPITRGVDLDLVSYGGFEHAYDAQIFTFEVFAALDDDAVSRLVQVELGDSWPCENVHHFLNRLQNVERLSLQFEDIPTLTEALHIPLDHPHHAALRVLPKLREISVTYGPRVNDSPVLREFSGAIEARRYCGFPITKLYLDVSTVPKDCILFSLENVGVQVIDSRSLYTL